MLLHRTSIALAILALPACACSHALRNLAEETLTKDLTDNAPDPQPVFTEAEQAKAVEAVAEMAAGSPRPIEPEIVSYTVHIHKRFPGGIVEETHVPGFKASQDAAKAVSEACLHSEHVVSAQFYPVTR